jgi:uncharacterized integral membrane protein
MLRKLKWLMLGLLAVLALILCLQNLATIQIQFLFSTIERPQAVVILVFMLIGFVMGLLANALWKVRAWRARVGREKLQQQKTESPKESAP